jgi:hypothetical protein
MNQGWKGHDLALAGVVVDFHALLVVGMVGCLSYSALPQLLQPTAIAGPALALKSQCQLGLVRSSTLRALLAFAAVVDSVAVG